MKEAVDNKAMNDFEERFQKVFDLKKNGELEAAYELLLQLAHERPNYPAVLGVLGDVCDQTGRLDEAIANFGRVTVLSPKSEMASLGLFHTLFKSGDTDGAFEEMKRFLSIAHSDEYELLLREIRESE